MSKEDMSGVKYVAEIALNPRDIGAFKIFVNTFLGELSSSVAAR